MSADQEEAKQKCSLCTYGMRASFEALVLECKVHRQ